MGVSAWILKRHLNETGSLSKAIAYYHSRTPSLGYAYKNKVVAAMRKRGLIRGSGTVAAKPRQTGGVIYQSQSHTVPTEP
jgi:hypothetical protein